MITLLPCLQTTQLKTMFSRLGKYAIRLTAFRIKSASPYNFIQQRKMSLDTMKVNIKVSPVKCLVDEPMNLSVDNLRPHQPITLAAILTEDRITYVSHCHVTANDQGLVELDKCESKGGTYTGINRNGLLWSMKLGDGQKKGLRMMKRDATTPYKVQFYALLGHRVVSKDADIHGDGGFLCQAMAERSYMGPNVKRIPVKHGRLRGTLFLPGDDGPFPGVIDMFGTAGGLNEYRAALLASRGIAAFSLAFFDYDDLPKTMVLEMKYFEEAMEWLGAHPAILKPSIGVIGVSKGGELANYMASINPKVSACVSINSYYFHSTAVHKYSNGQTVKNMQPDVEKIIVTDDGYISREAYLHPTGDMEPNLLRVEEAENAQFLFLCGDDDQMSDPEHARKLYARLQAAGKGHRGQVVEYHGSGHLLEPPYTPHHRATYHKLISDNIVFGGTCEGHSLAQEDSWRKILDFFRHYLPSKTDSTL